MKKILSVLTVLVLLVSTMPVATVSAEDVYTSGEWRYTLQDGNATITGYSGSNTDIVIPTMVDGYVVTKIGGYAFSDCSDLASVTILDGVTSIGVSAFSYCTSLVFVEIPDSVTAISDFAFCGCTSLANIGSVGSSADSQLTTIGSAAFIGCTSLTSVEVPDGVSTIGSSAFQNCTSLTNIDIPASVTTIGNSAFRDCTSLMGVGPIDSGASVEIPDTITCISEHAFWGCTSLTNVEIPDGVATIGYSAFRHCTALASVTIPESVTTISGSAFYSCTSLVRVTLGENSQLASIGDDAFYLCSNLTKVEIPASVTAIGDSAYMRCDSLTGVTFEENSQLIIIGSYAFWSCDSLANVTIPNSITDIGFAAFSACANLRDVYYTGTEEQANTISVGKYNEPLLNATWHYNYQLAPVVTFSGNSISKDVNGLAFKFDVAATGGQVYNHSCYVNGSAQVAPFADGQSYKLMRMGVVAANQNNADLILEHVDNECMIDIEAVYLWDWDVASLSFVIRIISIPADHKDTTIYARPYYVYEQGGEEIVVYGDSASQSYNGATPN